MPRFSSRTCFLTCIPFLSQLSQIPFLFWIKLKPSLQTLQTQCRNHCMWHHFPCNFSLCRLNFPFVMASVWSTSIQATKASHDWPPWRWRELYWRWRWRAKTRYDNIKWDRKVLGEGRERWIRPWRWGRRKWIKSAFSRLSKTLDFVFHYTCYFFFLPWYFLNYFVYCVLLLFFNFS